MFARAKHFVIALLFAVFLSATSLFAQAPASDDTFASADFDAKFGKLPFLVVQGPSSSTYIKFDLSYLPSGISADEVRKATVRLFVSGVTHAGTFDVQRVGSAWSEHKLSGESQPLLGAIELSNVAVSESAKGHYVVLDITSLVKDWLSQAQPNYGIALVPNGEISVAFDSKENSQTSHDPQLNVVLGTLSARLAGPQGLPGLQGPQGPAGPVGPQGVKGDTGPQGPAGPAGPVGPQGAAGPQGPVGPAGPAGPQGATGPQGPKGDTGATGAVGPQGPAGPQGLTGPQGAIGPQGPKGDTGASGAVGPQGPAGPAGPIGPSGPAGPQGASGPQGPKGDTGATGATGAQGPAGPAGPQGLQGDLGPQGPVGPAGPAGPQGATGPQGPKGDTGATGAAGAQGPAGPAGPQGAQGDPGPQGPGGPAGPQGATGAQGPKGDPGAMGPMGPQGPAGPAGPQGTSVGTNVAPFPYQSASNVNWQNYSAWCKIPASSIVNTASNVKLTLQFTAGATANIGAIKLFTTAPQSAAVASSVAMTIGGYVSPTIAIPSGTSNTRPFLVTTDAASITIDGTQDIYIVVYFSNLANNASVGVVSQGMSNGMPVFGGFVSGDQTGMTNVITSLGNTAITGTSTMNLFSRLVVAQ